MKRILTLGVAAVAAAAVLSACSSGGSSGGSGDSDIKIGVVLSDSSNPFFRTVSDGIKAQAQKAGVQIIERDAPVGTDTTSFNNNVDSVVSQGIKGLIVAPISASNLQVIKRARDRGIPVVELDSPIAGWNDYAAAIATDNVAAGEMSMNLLVDKLKSSNLPLQVGIVNNTLGFQSVNDRTEGAQKAAEAAGAKVTIIDGGVSQAAAQSAVETALRGNAQLSGLMTTVGSVYGLGANEAMRTSRVVSGKVFITGVDGTSAEVALVKAGPYYIGTAAQQPRLMGTAGLTAVVAAVKGEQVTKDQTVPPVAVTAANASTFQQ